MEKGIATGQTDWFPDVTSEQEQSYRNLVHVVRPLVDGMAIYLASEDATKCYKKGEIDYLNSLVEDAYRRMERYPALW